MEFERLYDPVHGYSDKLINAYFGSEPPFSLSVQPFSYTFTGSASRDVVVHYMSNHVKCFHFLISKCLQSSEY